jgi:hypothetical protein
VKKTPTHHNPSFSNGYFLSSKDTPSGMHVHMHIRSIFAYGWKQHGRNANQPTQQLCKQREPAGHVSGLRKKQSALDPSQQDSSTQEHPY